MCGIVGVLSKRQWGLWNEDIEIFERLLVLDEERGEDSTGVMSILPKGEVQVVKIGSHPHHLFVTQEYMDLRKAAQGRGLMMIGHNRAATRGAVTSENAHPFVEGEIVLVHNGTLRGDWKKELADVEVDSHAICKAFSQHPAEEVLAKIDGAFALVWYNAREGKLYAIRNDERPLHLLATDDLITLASESWMPGCQLGKRGKDVRERFMLEEGVLYEFDHKGTITKKKVELRKKYVYTGTQNGGSARTAPVSITPTENKSPIALPPFRQKMDSVRTLFGSHKDYKKGDLVAVKVMTAEEDNKLGRIRVGGHTQHPDKEKVDFNGFLEANVKMKDIHEWLESPAVCRVNSVHSSVCGPSLNCHEFILPPCETLNNNREIATLAWNAVVNECCCSECGDYIKQDEASITSVKWNAEGAAVVHCCDCIEKKLPEGVVKDEFIKRRNLTLQKRLPVGKVTGNGIILEGNAPSSSTVQ